MNPFFKKLLLLTAIVIVISILINFLFPVDLGEAEKTKVENTLDSAEVN